LSRFVFRTFKKFKSLIFEHLKTKEIAREPKIFFATSEASFYSISLMGTGHLLDEPMSMFHGRRFFPSGHFFSLSNTWLLYPSICSGSRRG
jgi:hypothetical protein